MDINKLMTNNLLRAAKRYQDTKTAKLQIDIKENQIILSAIFFSFFFPLYSLSFLYVNSICTVESFLYIAHFFFHCTVYLFCTLTLYVQSNLFCTLFIFFSFFFLFFSFNAESFCQKTCYTWNDNNNTNFTYIHNIHDKKKLTETSTLMAEAQRMPQHIE